MDENKWTKITSVEIDYKLNQTCMLCRHSNFPSPSSDWGTCRLHKYKHKKHTGELREMSIHKSGVCKNDFFVKEHLDLGKYQERF